MKKKPMKHGPMAYTIPVILHGKMKMVISGMLDVMMMLSKQAVTE